MGKYVNKDFNYVNYNKKTNVVNIYGCSTCPFLQDNNCGSVIEDPTCALIKEINVLAPNKYNYQGWEQKTNKVFPNDCPMRKITFRFHVNIR